ncbi:MAG: hypothetical protein ABIG32_00285 [Candidatus Uhrbacteria bacterium]|nr:hypothetical protein [Patescibacteria group bacterium]MBU1906761.1 hypothetical protein [Patescibacteria group bacterium]
MRFQTILIIILVILTIGLTIGQRFGFTWAGGDGYEPHLVLGVIDSVGDVEMHQYHRGQMVSTAAGERMVIANDAISIALDERTDVELVSTKSEETELYVHRGRVMVKADTAVKVRSNFVRSEFIDGQVSFVYYDFTNTVSIIPFDTKVNYTIAEQVGSTIKPINIMELSPYIIMPFEFDPTTSSAAEFYDWAL